MRGLAVVPRNTDEYLASIPEPARSALSKIRATIQSVVPSEATEAISYGMPTFKYMGPLFAFAAFKNHCSLFPMSVAVIEAFKDELKNFETSKGTIRFTPEKPPSPTLVKKMVRARIAENEARKAR